VVAAQTAVGMKRWFTPPSGRDTSSNMTCAARDSDRLSIIERLVLRFPIVGKVALAIIVRLPRGSLVRRYGLTTGIRSAAKLVKHGHVASTLWAYEPNVEYRLVGYAAATGLHEENVGHQGILSVFNEWTQLLGPPDFTIEDLVEIGDVVFATATLRGEGRASGVTVNHPVASIFKFSDRGRISNWNSYWDRAEAYRAAGLTPVNAGLDHATDS
jgi:ketosteroid isomerase-like protein